MGHGCRHFCALFKKNWIVWRRTPVASCCELFCPIALMGILVVSRLLVSRVDVAPTSNISSAVMVTPLYSNNGQTLVNDGSNHLPNLQAAMNDYQATYGPFGNFSMQNMTSNNQLQTLLLNHCS